MTGQWGVYPVPLNTTTKLGQPRPNLGGLGTWIARNPNCPEGPHPTRQCGCRFFRDPNLARKYANQMNQTAQEEAPHGNQAA